MQNASDLEDLKLNRLNLMKDQKLEYASITNNVLRRTGYQRSPDAAMKDVFLKSRTGAGAWGH